MWDRHVVVGHDVGSLGWKTTLQIKGDSGVEVAFSFFNLSSLSLLVGINEPLEVVLFELADIRVIFLFSDLNTLIPSVQLLIHSHGLFHLVVLEENCLGAMELLVEHG